MSIELVIDTREKDLISKFPKEKIKIELLLWDNCEHVWRRDPSACFDDIHKYFCSKCNLNKERSLYVCH